MTEPRTQNGQIAREEHATCYVCEFSDDFDEMIRVKDEDGGEFWAHRECQDHLESKVL